MYRYLRNLNFVPFGFYLKGILIIHSFTSLFVSERTSRTETNEQDREGAAKPEQSRTTD